MPERRKEIGWSRSLLASFSLNSDGSFTYVPLAGYSGLDHFGYTVNDGAADSNPANVVLAVNTTFTPPVYSADPPTPSKATIQTFPNNLQGLWDSYIVSKNRLGYVAAALAAFGNAASAVQSIDPNTTAGYQAIDAATAKLDTLYRLFDAYVRQSAATVSAAGAYMKTVYYTSQADADALNAINALPRDVAGLTPNKGQLQRFQLALANEAAGADWMVAQNTFTVEAAKDTHDALDKTVQYVGAATLVGGGLMAGGQILAKEGCAAFAKAAASKIANLAAGLAVNTLITQNVHYLAQKFGVSEDAMRIGADSVQLFFLVKALRAERQMAGANCFAGDTLVQTADGAEAIDQVQIGQRVLTSIAEGPDVGGPFASGSNVTQVSPANWRLLTLQMSDPASPGDEYDMELLEPLSWISDNSADVGGFVNLNLPELHISGPAIVENITACPAIEGGAGQVVLGTFQHVSGDVVDVNLAGETSPLRVTAGHKLWSLDRGAWVTAGSLQFGERLAGETGPIIVASVTQDGQSVKVFNLDVESDHRYLVSDRGVLAHNADPCDALSSLNKSKSDSEWATKRLRAAMEKAYGPDAMLGNDAHHGIPLELINDPQVGPIIQRAARGGFDINGLENGIKAPENHGPHPDYTKYIKSWITKDIGAARTPDGAKGLLDLIVLDARKSVGFWFK